MKREATKHQKSTRSKKPQDSTPPAPMTLMGHLNEIKNRLFWVTIAFVVSAALVYPFFTQIVNILTEPLHGEELHYFSPAGGLSFIIKICMYLGIVGALPFLIYHLYKFVQPIMTVRRTRSLVAYTLSSALLAVTGVVFTYTVILPAAVRFLTSFEIAGVDPLLSVDAYMSFVIAYIVAGALLFQLPLIMLIIDGINPLTPKKLLSYERHVLVGSFVAAALLSPTPDVINQSLLALPLVVMYQIGFILIVVRAKVKRRHVEPEKLPVHTASLSEQTQNLQMPPVMQPKPALQPVVATQGSAVTATTTVRRSIDGIVLRKSSGQHTPNHAIDRRPVRRAEILNPRSPARVVATEQRQIQKVERPRLQPQQLRSLDGFAINSY